MTNMKIDYLNNTFNASTELAEENYTLRLKVIELQAKVDEVSQQLFMSQFDLFKMEAEYKAEHKKSSFYMNLNTFLLSVLVAITITIIRIAQGLN